MMNRIQSALHLDQMVREGLWPVALVLQPSEQASSASVRQLVSYPCNLGMCLVSEMCGLA